MRFLQGSRKRIRLWYHSREIRKGLGTYRELTGHSAEKRRRYSDSGTFRSQVERLFALGSASETGELERIAHAAVTSCLTNRYYRSADFLSDISEALESRTYLSFEPEGEPPLSECDEALRKRKLDLVIKFYLAPVKVASIESILRRYCEVIGKKLPYNRFARFERGTARLYAVLGQSETTYVEQELCAFLDRWAQEPSMRERFRQPVDAYTPIMKILAGEEKVEVASFARLRKPGLPFRLSTLVPEDRQHLLKSALSRLH